MTYGATSGAVSRAKQLRRGPWRNRTCERCSLANATWEHRDICSTPATESGGGDED